LSYLYIFENYLILSSLKLLKLYTDLFLNKY
jgi:hypothetical protein